MEEGEGPRFWKFPKTPHAQGSSVVDDDAVVNTAALQAWRKVAHGRIVVQEKVDGANVSVHFEQDWQPIVQKRSGFVGTGEHEQYNVFRSWVWEHVTELWAVCGTEYVLFGEWLWAQHAVAYDELPSLFLAFDLLHKESGVFLSCQGMRDRIGDQPIHMVPTLWSGDVPVNVLEALQQHLGDSVFARDAQAEGVYVRLENDERVLDRVKLRRDTFVSGREDWGKCIMRNKVKEEGGGHG